MSLPRHADPVDLSCGDRDPLLHQPSVAGVEIRPSLRSHQLVDPFLWELYYQFAFDQHREDLLVDAQDVDGDEHLPSHHRSIASYGADDMCVSQRHWRGY